MKNYVKYDTIYTVNYIVERKGGKFPFLMWVCLLEGLEKEVLTMLIWLFLVLFAFCFLSSKNMEIRFILPKFQNRFFSKNFNENWRKIRVNFAKFWLIFTKSRFKFSKVLIKFLKIGFSLIKSPDFFGKKQRKNTLKQGLFWQN